MFGNIGKVYVYLKSDKTKSFKLKSTVLIHIFHPNNPPTKKELDFMYERPLKQYFPEFETIKFDYEIYYSEMAIYVDNQEDYELLKSKYEWK